MWLSIYNKEWDITVIQPISSTSTSELFKKALVDIWIDLYLIKFQFLAILCVFVFLSLEEFFITGVQSCGVFASSLEALVWNIDDLYSRVGNLRVSKFSNDDVYNSFIKNVIAVAAYSRLASRSQAKFHTKKLSPLVRPCAAAPAQSTTSAHRSLRFSPR